MSESMRPSGEDPLRAVKRLSLMLTIVMWGKRVVVVVGDVSIERWEDEIRENKARE